MWNLVQVYWRDHRWVSSWCWIQYRCIDVITGEWVLDVESSTGAITSTLEWTVVQRRRWRRLVCCVQRTHHLTVQRLPRSSVWDHLNWAQTWHHRNYHSNSHRQHQQHQIHQLVIHIFSIVQAGGIRAQRAVGHSRVLQLSNVMFLWAVNNAALRVTRLTAQ